jgi:hypothetical protein
VSVRPLTIFSSSSNNNYLLRFRFHFFPCLFLVFFQIFFCRLASLRTFVEIILKFALKMIILLSSAFTRLCPGFTQPPHTPQTQPKPTSTPKIIINFPKSTKNSPKKRILFMGPSPRCADSRDVNTSAIGLVVNKLYRRK